MRSLSAAMWLLQSEGKRFLASKTTVSALKKVTRDDTWESEKSMLKKKARPLCWLCGTAADPEPESEAEASEKEPTEADLLAEVRKKGLGKVKSKQAEASHCIWLAGRLGKGFEPAKSKPLQEHRPGSEEGAA